MIIKECAKQVAHSVFGYQAVVHAQPVPEQWFPWPGSPKICSEHDGTWCGTADLGQLSSLGPLPASVHLARREKLRSP